MVAEDALHDGETEAGAVCTAADHRVENGVLQLRSYARAVVDDFDLARQSVSGMADGELAQGAAAQGNVAVVWLGGASQGTRGASCWTLYI